jgi:hypothetical protein
MDCRCAWKCWLRNPEGCTVVIASPDGSTGAI